MIPVLDLRYYGLTESDNIHSKDGTSQTRLQWKGLGWHMQGRWINNYLEGDVSVMNKDGNIVMSLKFSRGTLNGPCTFYKEEVRIYGTWKDGECVSKTIPWDNGSYVISYRNNIPNGCSAFYDSSDRIRYSINYVNGIRDRYIDVYKNELHVLDGEFETVGGYIPRTFQRSGVTRIFKNGVIAKMAIYQMDKENKVLCLFNESSVIITDSDGHKVYEGTDENESIIPPTGNGSIFINDNVVYKGDLKNGLAHGQGEYYYNKQLFYKGNFKYGLPHGYGILSDNNKQELFQFGYAITRNVNIQDCFRQMHQRSICGDYMDSHDDILYTKVAQVFGDEYTSDIKEYERIKRQNQPYYSPQPVSPRTPSAINSPQPVSPSPDIPQVSVYQGSGMYSPRPGGQSTDPSSASSSIYSQSSNGQSSFSEQSLRANQQGMQVQLRPKGGAYQPIQNIHNSISDPTPNHSSFNSLSTDQWNDSLDRKKTISGGSSFVQHPGSAPPKQEDLIRMINSTSTIKMGSSSTGNCDNSL